MYKARLVGVYVVRETPDELRPFLNIEAKRQNRELKMSDRFAALQVQGTKSFFTFFLDPLVSIEDLDTRLAVQECELEPVSRRTLEDILSRKK